MKALASVPGIGEALNRCFYYCHYTSVLFGWYIMWAYSRISFEKSLEKGASREGEVKDIGEM